ncbi:MAG: hypothetical protein WCO35_04030 [Candidatus Nomurabacteria bacterium]
MKKIKYFFVSADVKFYKNYVNTNYNPDATDRYEFQLNEVFGIEQEETESVEIFYKNLKVKIADKVLLWMNTWTEEQNQSANNANMGWEWKKNGYKIFNISRV